MSQSGFVTGAQTLIHGSLSPPGLAKQHAEVSNLTILLSHFVCQPRSEQGSGQCTSFSNLSFSSNFVTQASASGWSSVSSCTAHPRVQPTAQRFISLLCSTVLCSVLQTSALNQWAFSGHRHTHVVVHKHLICEQPLLTGRMMANPGIPPWMPLFQDPFLQSPAQFNNGWFCTYLVGGNFNKQGNLQENLSWASQDK